MLTSGVIVGANPCYPLYLQLEDNTLVVGPVHNVELVGEDASDVRCRTCGAYLGVKYESDTSKYWCSWDGRIALHAKPFMSWCDFKTLRRQVVVACNLQPSDEDDE